MDLGRIYDPVREDLDAVSRLLRDRLSADDAFIGQLVEHVLHTKGKLLRPALVCLSALACGGGSGERLDVAGAVELIHVASLIHDDVIDAADLRRGQASVNAVWGNQVAVLLGDYLFSKSFHMLALVKSLDVGGGRGAPARWGGEKKNTWGTAAQPVGAEKPSSLATGVTGVVLAGTATVAAAGITALIGGAGDGISGAAGFAGVAGTGALGSTGGGVGRATVRTGGAGVGAAAGALGGAAVGVGVVVVW